MTGAAAGVSVDVLLAMLRSSLMNVAVAVSVMCIAPIKHPKTFLACMLLCGLLAYAMPSEAVETAWYFGGFIINYVALPFLFWKGRPARRILCAMLLPLLLLATELMDAILLLIMGEPITHGTISDSAKWFVIAPQCALVILGGTLIGRFLQTARGSNEAPLHCPPQYVLPLLLQLLTTTGVVQAAVSANLGKR